MDTLVVHLLNALLYASVMFLIAGGLSLIYGVMRIVNMAHGNLYAFGAYVSAWAVGRALGGATEASLWLYLLLPVGALGAAALGALLEPTLLRPLSFNTSCMFAREMCSAGARPKQMLVRTQIAAT